MSAQPTDVITPNFTVGEVFRDARHATPDRLQKAGQLLRTIVQPMRYEFGPIKITSGYRTPEHNSDIGGHPRSHHLYRDDSAAMDIVLLRYIHKPEKRLKAFEWILNNMRYGFGELGWYPKNNFFHVALTTPRDLGQVFIKTDSGTRLLDIKDAVEVIRHLDERL